MFQFVEKLRREGKREEKKERQWQTFLRYTQTK